MDRDQTQRLNMASEKLIFIRNKANNKDSLSRLSDAIDLIKK